MANLTDQQRTTYLSYLRAYVAVQLGAAPGDAPTELDEANAAALGASDARHGAFPRWSSHVLNAIRVMQDPSNTGGVIVSGSLDNTIGGPMETDAPYGVPLAGAP